jgi:DNA-binding CsgD family transcriptional regulator
MLFGREVECARIDAALGAACEQRSSALVLRGEAGIGKSVLLEYAGERAGDLGFQVLRALGVESEAEIAFASAHQLLRPAMDAVVQLPAAQSRALKVALAIEDGTAPERLTICAAMLSLLAAASETRPVLCIVDDAHWLDHASAQALTFVARRLHAEEVAMMFAVREPETVLFRAPGVPDLHVGALPMSVAKAMLAERAPSLAPSTAEQLIRLTEGNPLALVEIPRALSAEQCSGRAPLEQPLPVSAEIQRSFLERVNALANDAQRALLLVAAGDPADAEALWKALRAATVDGAVEETERAGLLLPGRLQFSHPLARSAVYQSISPDKRRAAHAALAAAATEPDRRAWHLAAAADRPDERVAAALEDAAAGARRRGGVAAEASALERAARLTADPEARARCLLKAAVASESAGLLERAETMLTEAGDLTVDPDVRAQAVARRSYLLFDRGEFDRAYQLAVVEAERADRGGAVSPATSGALRILWRRLDITRALPMADQAHRTAHPGKPNLDLATVVAWVWSLAGRVEEAHSLALSSLEQMDPGTWLAIDFGTVLLYVEDYPAARKVLEEVVDRSRAADAPGILSYALDQLAKLETRVGDLNRAYPLELESLQLTEPLGNDVALAASLIWLGLIESMLGRPEARSRAERALAIAERVHDPWNTVRARGVLGLDALGRGDAAAAVAWLDPAVATVASTVAHPNYLRVEGDLIEALARVGKVELAAPHLERLERQACLTKSPWALATAARCRAFLTTDAGVDEAFQAALELNDHEPSAFERARTELLYGERLRRVGQRRAARAQLQAAFETFRRIGARPWAERARIELNASGARLRRHDPTAAERLTPQELQIALLVAEGLTNRDTAARLFLSPKTVEFHLTRIYRKLEIHSRSELVRRRLDEGLAGRVSVS